MEKTTSKKQLPALIVLAIIAVAAALLLGLTNAITAGPIEEHRMAALNAAYSAVMPDAASYTAITVPEGYAVSGLYEAKDANGAVIGYTVTAASKGYAGDVAMTFGVDANGKVTGCVVGDTSFAETDGFGARAKEPAFQEQFEGLDAVNGGSFLPLSGATFTSKAVLAATNNALRCVAEVALGKEVDPNGVVSFGEKAAAQVDASALVPGARLVGEAEGYGGANVIVKIKLDDDANIASIKVDASSQTPGIGQRCAGAEFTDLFVGKSIPVEGIDVLSGATLTSNAVIEAINGAQPSDEEEAEDTVVALFEQDGVNVGVNGEGAAVVAAPGYNGTVVLTLNVENGQVVSGELGAPAVEAAASVGDVVAEYKAKAEGFQSDVTVVIGVDANGAISSLTIKADGETAGLGQRCGEESFAKQFIGKTAPVSYEDAGLSAISGATITSNAVIEAISKAMPAAEAAPAAAATEYKAKAEGFQSDVTVIVGVDENGAISSLTIQADGETAGLGRKCGEADFAKQFIGKTAPVSYDMDGLDAVSGATITSNAVVEAINKAVPAAEAAPAAAATEYKAKVEGFQSDVTVIVGVDENGTIASLTIKADGETAGLGQKCGEADFAKQFIGKTAPVSYDMDGLDAVSGATITSNVVVEAINKAVSK